MTLAANLRDLADLCQTAAHQNLAAIIALGPRPSDPTAAAAWDITQARLRGQLDRLTAMAMNLASEAVAESLAAAKEDLEAISAVTAKARKRIVEIKRISSILTAVGAVLDLALAVMTLAGAPSLDHAKSLVKTAKALGEAVDNVDEE